MERKKLAIGEIYLKVLISDGGVDKTYVVFPNEHWTPENNQPKFRTNSSNHSIAVWANKKKEPKIEVDSVI
jgi:hypothetical protein